ncbi:protein-disulfide reductase DsbD [Methylovorus mays]|uniref:protein-disulfide reductase DsbD n=1 Tax=Methylovorus mays TaxID=184077 RepID=UPI001E6314A4|nr:protein-disulfide reductase DsbD [Methylovorus mays]MCB5207810.1 protein-disulfide reductase DsbD [Methylovorus mays]
MPRVFPKHTLLLLMWMLLVPIAHALESDAPDNNSSDFLEPDQAFQLEMKSIASQRFQAEFSIAPGYYLYRKRISFHMGPDGQDLPVIMPSGEMKQDPNLGESEVYHQHLVVTGNLPATAQGAVTVIARYQGCSEHGLCYPPMEKTVNLSLPVLATVPEVSPEIPMDKAGHLLQGGKLWLVILGFFGFGLLLSLTPCVFPMIPILSGIIVGQGQTTSRLQAFNLSLAYTLGMAVSYTVAGVIAGLSGHLISAALQSPWVLGTSGLLFVLLSLSMFGFYELKMPGGMESSVLGYTNRIKGGRLAGVFVMGVLSALIVSPCVAAPLAGALLYIGQTHDVVLGGMALFSLSLGMGVPLLVVGASAGALLPKAGRWMEVVRNFFGVVMLGMAIWIISPVISVSVQMLLWAALLVVSSIYLHALDSLPPNKTRWQMFCKGCGVLVLLMGVSLFLGAMTGSQNLLQPLVNLHAEAKPQVAESGLAFQPVQSLAELDSVLADTKGRAVVLDFYADWCAACKEYERTTFRDARVKNGLKDALLLQVDMTKNTVEQQAMLKRFKLFGPPGLVFFNAQGLEMRSAKIVGYQEVGEFITSLQRAGLML